MRRHHRGDAGLIPAWAGKTKPRPVSRSQREAHPRVGGENAEIGARTPAARGSSPRGRGKLVAHSPVLQARRLIPAWAGKTQPTVPDERARPGSSPRGRGKRGDLPSAAAADGLIPAWAGKTKSRSPMHRWAQAHPRVGGENYGKDINGDSTLGSSPRGRGKHMRGSGLHGRLRLIPAWAGKTRVASLRAWLCRAHPRVGGENAELGFTKVGGSGSSPRGRGKHSLASALGVSVGLIPAWAGKTRTVRTAEVRSSAHPRVGGENASSAIVWKKLSGSSPRGRGKPFTTWVSGTASVAHPRVGGENRRLFPT